MPNIARLTIAALLLSSPMAWAQGGIQQQEHDKQIRADTERNTKYHNNADDYPAATDNSALAKKIADGFKSAPKAPPLPFVPSATDLAFFKALDDFKAGDPNAGYILGMRFYHTNYATANETALYYFLAIQDRILPARFLAGQMLVAGEGAPSDYDRGLALIRSASAAGSLPATTYLKTPPARPSTVSEFPSMLTRAEDALYSKGLIVKSSFRLDPKVIKMVEQRSPKASYFDYTLGGMTYLYGIGVPVDMQKAKELLLVASQKHKGDTTDEPLAWLYLAGLQKDPAAFQAQVGQIYPLHDNWPEEDYLHAFVACMNHQPAQQRYDLEAAIHVTPGNYATIPEARMELALMQLTGEGGPLQEEAGRANLLATASSRSSQYFLYRMYDKGLHGFEKDPAKAMQFLKSAAAAGQPNAIQELSQKEPNQNNTANK